MMNKRGYAGYKKKGMNKRGGLTDLFVLIIFALVLVFVSGIMIYIGIITSDALHETLDDADLSANMTEVIDNSIGELNNSYQALYWISIFLIMGMIIAIFIGSYMVTTKPIYFFPYIFIVIIAIVVAVGVSIAYTDFRTEISDNGELTEVFDGFVGANYFFAWLPLWIAVIGIVGGVIMASRVGTGQDVYGGSYG